MITESMVYWVLILDNIKTPVDILSIVISLLFAVCVIMWAITSSMTVRDSEEETSYRLSKRGCSILGPLFVIFLSASIFLPSTKQMAAIYVIPKMANNENIQQMPDKIAEIGMAWIDELRPKTNPKNEAE